jgi:hypothetical protein
MGDCYLSDRLAVIDSIVLPHTGPNSTYCMYVPNAQQYKGYTAWRRLLRVLHVARKLVDIVRKLCPEVGNRKHTLAVRNRAKFRGVFPIFGCQTLFSRQSFVTIRQTFHGEVTKLSGKAQPRQQHYLCSTTLNFLYSCQAVSSDRNSNAMDWPARTELVRVPLLCYKLLVHRAGNGPPVRR